MPTIEAFYLGTTYDLDPLELDYDTEYANDLVGLIFGSVADPLYDNIELLTLTDSNGDGTIESNDLLGFEDDLTYGGVSSGLDSEVQYDVTVTYSDGTTALTTMLVFQDALGRVFLAPHIELHADNDVLNDHPIVSIELGAVSGDGYSGVQANLEQDAFITCFVTGTLIATKLGLKKIEKLSVGDKVCTMDHGYQPIRWIGAKRVRAIGRLAPIKIMAGALGQGLPTRDLWVSPQHRILVRSKIARRMFGCFEVLLPAKKLLGMPSVIVDESNAYVTYWHFLFDHHEIVFSEGAATESFYTGPQVLKSMDAATRAEIFALFPSLAQGAGPPSPARLFVTGKRPIRLLERHLKNGHQIYQEGSIN